MNHANVEMLKHQREFKKIWTGWIWVSPKTVTDMLALLPYVHPLYLDIHKLQEGRLHWIVGITLQTTDPAKE